MNDINDYWQNYINGDWVDGGAGRIDVINPGNGEKLAEQALADETDVDKAVNAAQAAHLSGQLSQLRPAELGRMVNAMGTYLLDNIEEIASVLTLEQGKPLWESKVEIEGSARFFEYYGNQAETMEGRSIPLGGDYFDFTYYEPYGVSAHIIPWNYPIEMIARSLSAALATANTVVIKTSELTPLSSAYIARAAEAAGFPKGVVNIVCGYGTQAGNALTSHPLVRQIVFTGSVPTGIAIATAAAKNVVPCVLELGGKSAAIVHDDADLDAFINDVRWGIYFNAGQVCSAMSRVIVHQSVHDEVVSKISSMAESLSVGAGIDRPEFGANMGSLVSEDQRNRAIKMVQHALNEGANIATGGNIIDQPGAFMQPTVITNVNSAMQIAQQEVFGPVLSVLPFEHDDEAIQIANGTEFGLVAGVFTSNLDRATQAARQMRAGQVFINEWYAGGVETPFGGFGKSGYGREKGREALWNYVQTKNVAIKMRNK